MQIGGVKKMAQLCIHENTASGRCCAMWAFLLGGQAKASCIAECLTGRCSCFLAHFVSRAQQLCSVMIAYAVTGNQGRLCCTGPPFVSPSCRLSHTLVCHCTLLLGLPGIILVPALCRAGVPLEVFCKVTLFRHFALTQTTAHLQKALPGMRPEKGKGSMGGEH